MAGTRQDPEGDDRPFWAEPLAELLTGLGSGPTGLTDDEAARRLARFGPNRLEAGATHPGLRLLLSQFRSPVTILLIAAAGLSLVVRDTVDALIILGIILASGLLSWWQERRATDVVARLLATVQLRASALRGGRVVEIPVHEVVPGDVVLLGAGDAVPADARLLESKDLHVDEAALTGESYPAEKQEGLAPAAAPVQARRNALFLGTHVVSGAARAVVVRTGRATEMARVSASLGRRQPETAFGRGTRRFGYLLLEIALVLALVIFAVNVALHRPVLESLLFTLALAVGLTPQLLPAIVTVTLAQGARRMAARQLVARRLTAIEDVGGITVLCTDKTGTLTEGTVSIDAAIDVEGNPSGRVLLLACLNAAASSGLRNPIDEALRQASPPGTADYAKVDEVPYDFVRKRLSVLVARGDEGLLITKGAVANVLEICVQAEGRGGARRPIAEVGAGILERFEALSREGYRCLGVAFRDAPPGAQIGKESERDMVFAGLLCLRDPPKEDALECLRQLATLGIAAKMVTGDNRHVAAQIGREAGLDPAALLTGAQLRAMSDAALRRRAMGIEIFAEVDPTQKERIILALRKGGRAVGYLGDGINDAPALHAADVGISVNTAADVTKQAADIVLLRKDLGVLAEGVREGRRAFANTLKYVFITASANFGNMFSMAGVSLFSAFLPMLPKQILLLNVLSDLPAMAIATDRLDEELVARPRRWDIRAIQRFMLVFGLISSGFDFLTFVVLWRMQLPAGEFRTAWFIESLLSEILILLVIRTRRAFFASRPGPGLVAASGTVAFASLALPWLPLGPALGFAPPSFAVLAALACILTAYVAVSEVAKRAFHSSAHL